MAGLLSTGRNELAQADDASKQATGLANAMAASNANITMAKRNAKSTAMGQGLGGLASMGLSQLGSSSAGAGLGAAGTAAATDGGALAASGVLGQAGVDAVTPALASLGGEAAGAGAAAGAAGAGAAGAAGLGATAAAAIPFVGWAAAAGLLAYSMFG